MPVVEKHMSGRFQWVVLALAIAAGGGGAQGGSIFDDPQNWPSTPEMAPKPAPRPHPAPEPTPAPAPTPEPAPSPEPTPAPKPAPSHPAPVAPSPKPAPEPVEPAVKHPLPDAAAQAKVLKLVKEIFGPEYKERTVAAKRQLATELETEADKIEANFAARYVLLAEAQTASLGAHDVALLRRAVEGINRDFVVDPTSVTVDALGKLMELSPEDPAVVSWGLDAVDARMAADDYAGAHRLMAKMPSARVFKLGDATLRTRWRAATDAMVEGDRAKAAFDRLKVDPNDPAANFAAGKYLCQNKHDWEKGLAYLAKSSDAKIKAAAAADLANPADTNAKYLLAGKWWDIGADAQHAAVKELTHQRANYWYGLILGDLDGLQKVVADRRLAEQTATAKPATPSAAPSTPGKTATAAADPNDLLSKMVLVRGQSEDVDGARRLRSGTLMTPTEATVPFQLDVIAMTDSNNLELGFGRGLIVLNQENGGGELVVLRPDDGTIFGLDGKGSIPVNTFVHIRWTVTDTVCQLVINGEERANIPGKYAGIKSAIRIFPSNGSTITVKAVALKQRE